MLKHFFIFIFNLLACNMRNILLILGYFGLHCMCMCATLRASLSGTFPQRMDVVNQCLEFACLCVCGICVCGGGGGGGGGGRR